MDLLFFLAFFSLSLFFFSSVGLFLSFKHVIIMLISLELLLLTININFVMASVFLDDFFGQLAAFFLLSVAASESSIGLGILIIYFRLRGTIFLDSVFWLKS